jgi:arabinan endo-1,5-alpha-L-arabinosidase
VGVLLLLGLSAIDAPARAQTSGANGTHDPSRMIESEGQFYVYSTGGGSKSSADGLVWTAGPGLFPNGIPQSTTSVVSNNQGVWAPDVIYLNGQYYLYYSIANSQNACAIGLVTSPTLNPNAANYKWMDRGLVVSNNGSATYCTIDPAPVLDAAGNLWLAWGSGYSHPSTSDTIWVTRLDNTTGLVSSADTAQPGHALEQGHIEASYIYYHSGYYYLFWNSGSCCSGASSSYVIHMARSQLITGPYTGATIFYSSNGSIHGPGHIGIYNECGFSRFTYHYYPDTGNSVLGENELTWGGNGWPVVGALSTTRLTPCGQSGDGGAISSGGAGDAAGVGDGPSGDSSGAGVVTAGSSSGPGSAEAGGSLDPGASGGASGSGGTNGIGDGGEETGGVGVVRAGGATAATPTWGSSSASSCSCGVPGGAGPNDTGIALLFGGALEVARRRQKRKSHR